MMRLWWWGFVILGTAIAWWIVERVRRWRAERRYRRHIVEIQAQIARSEGDVRLLREILADHESRKS